MISRLLLWDVDGTLVRAGDIGAAVFDQAIEALFGVRPPKRVKMSGKTDPQIVREYLELMAIAELDDHVPKVLEQVEAEIAAAAGRLAEIGHVQPGIPEVLARLAKEPVVHQTVLTGNTAANATVKVGAFGLQPWLDLEIGAFGSDHADRRELVPIAVDRARRLRGLDVDASSTWVVGDTVNDLACALAGGAHCLLVATGGPSVEELDGNGADAVLADLTDTEAVVRLLTGR
jgi:phosphoglycolate phosphatase-like HAD superfamily hydrolase